MCIRDSGISPLIRKIIDPYDDSRWLHRIGRRGLFVQVCHVSVDFDEAVWVFADCRRIHGVDKRHDFRIRRERELRRHRRLEFRRGHLVGPVENTLDSPDGVRRNGVPVSRVVAVVDGVVRTCLLYTSRCV